MLSVSGPDHDRVFECAVFYRKEELGRGRGKSKKEAESQAAFNALMALRQPATTAEQAKEPQPGEVQGSEVK
jgi:ribonuclease-3